VIRTDCGCRILFHRGIFCFKTVHLDLFHGYLEVTEVPSRLRLGLFG
jgi:hypothetical protein